MHLTAPLITVLHLVLALVAIIALAGWARARAKAASHPGPQEAERARQFYELAINVLPQGMMIKDEAGRFVTANRAWCQIAGLSLERIVGKTVWDIYPPDEARELQNQDDQAYAANSSVVFEQPTSVISGRRGWTMKTKTVLTLRDGSRFLVRGTVDITALKQATLEVERSRNFLEAVMNALPVSLSVQDRDARFVLVNRAEASLYGMEPHE